LIADIELTEVSQRGLAFDRSSVLMELKFTSIGPSFAPSPLLAALSTAAGESGFGALAATAADVTPRAAAVSALAARIRSSFDM